MREFPHWDRGSEEIKQYVKQCESHGERTHRPCQPRSRTSAHPTDSSPLFACSFRHNATLQHRRLSSVTATVTKPSGKRTSENSYSRDCLENAPRHDGGLRSALWRARDTPRICPMTNGTVSALICPSTHVEVAPGSTACGRSSMPSSTF